MNLEPYSSEEAAEIQEVLNKKYFQLTPFQAEDLHIEVKPKYFFDSSNGLPPEAYLTSLTLKRNNEVLDFDSLPFTVKSPASQVAHLIAHEIWAKFDGRMDSALWNNFS